jgi:hypothetical protein
VVLNKHNNIEVNITESKAKGEMRIMKAKDVFSHRPRQIAQTDGLI